MRIRPITVLASAAVVCAAAAAPSPAAQAKRGGTFVYAYRSNGPAVLAYRWESDGSLTPLAGSPFVPESGATGCGGFCGLLGYSKKRKALVMPGGKAMNVLLVGEDGALTPAAGSPYALDDVTDRLFGTVALDRGAQTFVYTSDFGGDAVRAFTMAADGSLTEIAGSPFATGDDGPVGLVATARNVVALNERGGSLSGFVIGRDGALTRAPGSPLAMGAEEPWNLHLDPRGRNVYAGGVSGSRLFGFSLRKKTGDLAALRGSPFQTTITNVASGPSFAKKGPAVLVASDDKGIESAVVARNGSITPIPGTVDTTLTRIQAHGRSPNGKFLVIAGTGDQGEGLYTFAVNRKSGELTPVGFAADATTGVSGLQVVRR